MPITSISQHDRTGKGREIVSLSAILDNQACFDTWLRTRLASGLLKYMYQKYWSVEMANVKVTLLCD